MASELMAFHIYGVWWQLPFRNYFFSFFTTESSMYTSADVPPVPTTFLLILHRPLGTLNGCLVSEWLSASHTTKRWIVLKWSSKGANSRLTPNMKQSFLWQEKGLECKHRLHNKRLGEFELQVQESNDTNTSQCLSNCLFDFRDIIVYRTSHQFSLPLCHFGFSISISSYLCYLLQPKSLCPCFLPSP